MKYILIYWLWTYPDAQIMATGTTTFSDRQACVDAAMLLEADRAGRAKGICVKDRTK